MGLIKDLLLDVCANKALKYDMKIKMLFERKDNNYKYAIRMMIFLRDIWLDRIKKLSDNIF